MPHALIIDDSISNLRVLAEMLDLLGVTYTEVQDVQTLGTTIFETETIDVVFLDLEMPNMDGYKIFDYLRGLEKCASIPIVAHTVHISEIGTAHEIGFNSFIPKPLNSELFPEQLADILSGKEIWTTK